MNINQLIRKLEIIRSELGGEDRKIVVHSPEGFMDLISVWTSQEAPAIVVEIKWERDDEIEVKIKTGMAEV